MATVYLCSPTNSTMFTTCCDCAVSDNQNACPNCGQAVEPQGASARWSAAYGKITNKTGWYGNDYPNHGEGRWRGARSFTEAARRNGRIR